MNIISEFQKNAKELMRVSLVEFKGHKLVDLRIYWQDKDGEWKPGQKGVTFASSLLPEVLEAFTKAVQAQKENT